VIVVIERTSFLPLPHLSFLSDQNILGSYYSINSLHFHLKLGKCKSFNAWVYVSKKINAVIVESQTWVDNFETLGVSLSNFCILVCFSKYWKSLKHYFHLEMFVLFPIHQNKVCYCFLWGEMELFKLPKNRPHFLATWQHETKVLKILHFCSVPHPSALLFVLLLSMDIASNKFSISLKCHWMLSFLFCFM